jgi:hypothetical protein
MHDVSALLTLACSAVLVLAGYAHESVVVLAVALLQVALAFSWHEANDLPGRRGGAYVASLAGVGASVAVFFDAEDGEVSPLLGAVGIGFVAALLHQLIRREGRPDVVASLSGTVTLIALVVLPATWVAERESRGGAAVIACAATAVAVAVLGTLLPRWPLLGGVLGLAGGTAAGAGAATLEPILGSSGRWIAAAAAFVAITAVAIARFAMADVLARGIPLPVATAATSLTREPLAAPPGEATGEPMEVAAIEPPDPVDRTRQAQMLVTATLPLVLAGPAAYVLGRVLVG